MGVFKLTSQIEFRRSLFLTKYVYEDAQRLYQDRLQTTGGALGTECTENGSVCSRSTCPTTNLSKSYGISPPPSQSYLSQLSQSTCTTTGSCSQETCASFASQNSCGGHVSIRDNMDFRRDEMDEIVDSRSE